MLTWSIWTPARRQPRGWQPRDRLKCRGRGETDETDDLMALEGLARTVGPLLVGDVVVFERDGRAWAWAVDPEGFACLNRLPDEFVNPLPRRPDVDDS